MKNNNMRKVPLLVIDYGSQTTQLILRRVREEGVYCEMVGYKNINKYLKNTVIQAIILSGGPASSFKKNAPKLEKKILSLKVPILGICYGMQSLCLALGGSVRESKIREFGKANINILEKNSIFFGISRNVNNTQVWMSHGDEVHSIPKNFSVIARTKDLHISAIADKKLKIYGVQFHPEVIHTIKGKEIIKNFLFRVSNIKPNWKIANYLENKITELKKLIRDGNIICGLSGGVDSAVTAALLQRIVGKRLICIFVNHGFLRMNEENEVKYNFKKYIDTKLIYIDAKKLFLERLKGIKNPEKKRKIIGREFVKVFQKQAKKIKDAKYLAQGTLYPDVIESKTIEGSKSKNIKTHHNVGGLPKNMNFTLIEPLRELFKDEVRELGKKLGLPTSILKRHPFPGPGLAIRIPGEVTKLKIDILKNVDNIFLEELRSNKIYNKIWQAFAVLLPVKSVGVMGDSRSYEYAVSLRAITSTDGMTADIFIFSENFLKKVSGRIVGEVKGVNRVLYDITSKPPATIEWE